MAKASNGDKTDARRQYWRERIAVDESSGLSVERFCEQQGITEQSSYIWRKPIREEQQPPRFALVETAAAALPAAEPVLKLTLVTGDRLHIGGAVDVTFLRRVLEGLFSLVVDVIGSEFCIRLCDVEQALLGRYICCAVGRKRGGAPEGNHRSGVSGMLSGIDLSQAMQRKRY